MPHQQQQAALTFFDDWEDDAIEAWLAERDLEFGFPTVCGSCCGFYEAEFWVDLSRDEIEAFNSFAREKGIGGYAHSGGIRIGSPPDKSGER